jgi:hypothetical protein
MPREVGWIEPLASVWQGFIFWEKYYGNVHHLCAAVFSFHVKNRSFFVMHNLNRKNGKKLTLQSVGESESRKIPRVWREITDERTLRARAEAGF